MAFSDHTSTDADKNLTPTSAMVFTDGSDAESQSLFERNKWAIISVLTLLGLLFLLLLPGAVYGYTKVSKSILTYEIAMLKDQATAETKPWNTSFFGSTKLV